MLQRITEDDDGNTALEFDEEGIEYLIQGLQSLAEDGPGGLRTTPSMWKIPAPWWRFWDRSGDPVVGEFRLRYVR